MSEPHYPPSYPPELERLLSACAKMQNTGRRVCGTCRFFVLSEEMIPYHAGTCHRYAPRLIARGYNTIEEWPGAMGDNFCGEWEGE